MCANVAAIEGDIVHIISVIGSSSAVKAARAMFMGNAGDHRFRIEYPNGAMSATCVRCEDGYSTYRQRASALDYWHLLMVSKKIGLLPSVDEQRVWQELRSDRYTTPILRQWVPFIIDRLTEVGRLRRLGGFGHNAGLLTASCIDLDNIVSRGLKYKQLQIC
jgi:hypothetical protein